MKEEKEQIKQEVDGKTDAVNPERDSEAKVQENETEAAKKLADEFKDKWMRSVAEFDNYKKRNARLYQDAYAEGKADVIVKILSIGDNLDTAISMGLDEKTTEGLILLKKKYDEVLKSADAEEINPIGEQFDPTVAEAIMQAEGGDGEESGTIKQVFQKGYKIKDKIIRYAKVSVIK